MLIVFLMCQAAAYVRIPSDGCTRPAQAAYMLQSVRMLQAVPVISHHIDVMQVSTPAALLCALHGSEVAGSGLLEAVLCPKVTFLLASLQPLLLTLWALHIPMSSCALRSSRWWLGRTSAVMLCHGLSETATCHAQLLRGLYVCLD